MHKEFLPTLSILMEAKDKLDTEIMGKTAYMIFGLNLRSFILPDKEICDSYLQNIINLTQNLLKANEHYRKYILEENLVIKEFREKNLKDSNINVNLTINPISLLTEIEGLLTQLKAGLDTLAVSLNPILGLNLNGWHTEKNRSGAKVLKSLDNLSADLKIGVKPLYNFIEKNIEWLSYIVKLRDMPIHHGGIKSIIPILYDYQTTKVFPQKIVHSQGFGDTEKIEMFLLRTIIEMTDFFHTVIVLSLQPRAHGLKVIPDIVGGIHSYSWGIPQP
jgi:hypothetical protein